MMEVVKRDDEIIKENLPKVSHFRDYSISKLKGRNIH